MTASARANDTAVNIGVEPAVDQQTTREQRRLAVLQAAATFAAGKALNAEVSSADVLKIAESWERWITRHEPRCHVAPGSRPRS